MIPRLAIDTAKTVLQIDSVEGFRSLMRRVKAGRIGLLYSGAIANAVAAILGHYPWVRFCLLDTHRQQKISLMTISSYHILTLICSVFYL